MRRKRLEKYIVYKVYGSRSVNARMNTPADWDTLSPEVTRLKVIYARSIRHAKQRARTEGILD